MAIKWLLIVLTGGLGMLLAFQSTINSQLGKALSAPFQAALVSFTGGWLTLAMIVGLTGGWPSLASFATIPWYLLSGGVVGAFFVTGVIALLPKVGTVVLVTALVCGQILGAVMIDHWGVLGTKVNPININKVVGCCLLIGGVYLVGKA